MRQFTIIVTLFTVGSAILITPSALAIEAKQNAWIAAILGVCTGLLTVYLYRALTKQFPNQTLVEMCEAVFGFFYASTLSFAQIMKMKEARPLHFPLAMILIVLSIISYPNASYFLNFVSKIWFPYALTFGFLLPVCMIGVAVIRKI
ncbi:GerAB/ArcD/ProY family transporter [Paenibacillus sedimenti]|uniref:GerAB/ArcD/ProY family transporter n=1 Tax=Paenibacillus sedimenti TaxID=2770274 RepID=UPI00289EE080|nr:GerAB/ArcD/ProY family transporter [Paenibacillus sedimenti]